MKPAKQRQGLEERRAEYDQLSADKRHARRRPGSLNAGGPAKQKRKRR